MFKKSFIFAAALSIALSNPAFADGKINTKYGVFKAKIDPTEYVANLTLAGKKIGQLEADNIQIDKVFSIGQKQVVALYSLEGNSGYKNYWLVAIFPNKTTKIFDDFIESKTAKYKVKDGKFIATYGKKVITFDGNSFHQ